MGTQSTNIVSDPTVLATVFRSEDIYFEDGNIVLLAGETAFRVHRGQLMRQSVVFRDMFAIIEEPHEDDMFDGCPVVRLHDAPVTLAAFLTAMYDCTQFKLESIDNAILILPLASKYIVDSMRDSIMAVLRQCFPDTLEKWNTMKEPNIEYAAAVIKGTKEVGALSILPSAFYSLSTIPLSSALEHFNSTTDMATFCLGREELRCVYIALPDINLPLCTNEKCIAFLRDWKTNMRNMVSTVSNIPGKDFDLFKTMYQIPGASLSTNLWFGSTNRDVMTPLCVQCRKECSAVVRNHEADVWHKLPGFFGLESWEKLRET